MDIKSNPLAVKAILSSDEEEVQKLNDALKRIFKSGEKRFQWLHSPCDHLEGKHPAEFILERDFKPIMTALQAQFPKYF